MHTVRHKKGKISLLLLHYLSVISVYFTWKCSQNLSDKIIQRRAKVVFTKKKQTKKTKQQQKNIHVRYFSENCNIEKIQGYTV
jgi:hypothetical protein